MSMWQAASCRGSSARAAAAIEQRRGRAGELASLQREVKVAVFTAVSFSSYQENSLGGVEDVEQLRRDLVMLSSWPARGSQLHFDDVPWLHPVAVGMPAITGRMEKESDGEPQRGQA